jgi:hypothetical protein
VREANSLGMSVPYNEAIWAAVSGIDARHARERVTPHLDEAAFEAAARREQAARS